MKIKSLIFGLLFSAGLLFSMPVFAYTYTRTPAGAEVNLPLTFSVSFDDWEDTGCIYSGAEFWGIKLNTNGIDTPPDQISEFISSSTLSFDFIFFNPAMVDPLGYAEVLLFCSVDGEEILGYSIIFEEGTPAFKVVEAPASTGGNIITLPEGMATSMLAYAGQSFSDLAPLLLIGIGLMLAFWLISNALRLTNILDKTKSKKINSWDFFAKEQKEKFKKDDWL